MPLFIEEFGGVEGWSVDARQRFLPAVSGHACQAFPQQPPGGEGNEQEAEQRELEGAEAHGPPGSRQAFSWSLPAVDGALLDATQGDGHQRERRATDEAEDPTRQRQGGSRRRRRRNRRALGAQRPLVAQHGAVATDEAATPLADVDGEGARMKRTAGASRRGHVARQNLNGNCTGSPAFLWRGNIIALMTPPTQPAMYVPLNSSVTTPTFETLPLV